jgi:hypothetical protein
MLAARFLLLLLLLLWCCVVRASVADFPEYNVKGSRLSNGERGVSVWSSQCADARAGPHLLLDEYAFMRAPLGGVRELTLECWIYLRDW